MLPIRHVAPQTAPTSVQTPTPVQPVKKYNIQYGQNGEIFYNNAIAGNYYTSNIFEIGEDRFLENWAKQNEFDLQPSQEWIEQQNQLQKNRIPIRSQEEREGDVSEQNVMQTFGVSDQQRNSAKPGAELNFNAPAGMKPMTSFTANQGFTDQFSQNSDVEGSKQGFAPQNLNPFFTEK